MNPRGMIAATVCLLALTSCGGAAEEGEPAAAASPTTTTAEPAESDGCRSTLASVEGIAGEMETVTVDAAEQFTQLFNRLTALQDLADRECSPDVMEPLDQGVYDLAKANAGYTACEFVELCDSRPIEENLINGTALLREAVDAATATG